MKPKSGILKHSLISNVSSQADLRRFRCGLEITKHGKARNRTLLYGMEIFLIH
jgi:hypothetical protein